MKACGRFIDFSAFQIRRSGAQPGDPQFQISSLSASHGLCGGTRGLPDSMHGESMVLSLKQAL